MTRDDEEFLATYDASDFKHPSVTVDLVLMSVLDGNLHALVMRRASHPDKGKWALPGSFVQIDESLDEAAQRVLRDKARLASAYIEQIYTFGAVDRDPRTRVITIAYFALLPESQFTEALKIGRNDLQLARIQTKWKGETGGPVEAFDQDGKKLSLAFDHADILGVAVKRLRGKLDYSRIAFELLPSRFTLRELQNIHEAISGETYAKPAFRRRVLDKGFIEPTGLYEQGTAFRPAELYKAKKRNTNSI